MAKDHSPVTPKVAAPLRKGLLWDCYVTISNWDARYNGRPSSHKEANEAAENGLWAMLEKLDAHFFPEDKP